jgi:hypothetical protein
MADSQIPWGLEALNGTVTEPAWRSKPSWYLVTTADPDDRAPALQRTTAERAGATTSEVAGSHAIYVSQPSASQPWSNRPHGRRVRPGQASRRSFAVPDQASAGSSGGLISRFRILPVGPFGNSSTSQTRRGYL